MKKFRFLEWNVYRDSQDLCKSVFDRAGSLPQQHRYGVGDQLVRSCTSVILNIAEGSGKTSDKELNRFLDIALGSLYETLAGADMLRKNNFITEESFLSVQSAAAGMCDQLGGFKKSIRARPVVGSV